MLRAGRPRRNLRFCIEFNPHAPRIKTTMSMPGSSRPPERKLVRALTLVPTASVILANTIGTGVFLKARVMTCNVGTPGMVLTVWLAAGLLSLAGAIVYAELGTMMPRSGGEIHFLGAAYGRRWAFLYGWTRSIALGASIAASAIVFVIFLNDLVDGALHPAALQWLPVLVIVVATGLNLMTVRSSGRVATGLTIFKLVLVLTITIGAFALSDGTWTNFLADCTDGRCEGVPESARGGLSGFSAAMLGALWSYSGWNIIASIGSEVKEPGRTLPRALIGSTSLVILLYLAINAAYFYVLTPTEVASVPESSSVARETAMRFFGKSTAAIFSAGLMISAYGTLHSTLLTGTRLPYALARNGMLPRPLAHVSRAHVPSVAIIALGAWGIGLTLTGSFDILTDMYVFILWVFYGMCAAGLFVLRRKKPDAERPYRVTGYPVVPALFLLVTAFLLTNTLIAMPGRAAAGLILILLGLPVYSYYARRNPAQTELLDA